MAKVWLAALCLALTWFGCSAGSESAPGGIRREPPSHVDEDSGVDAGISTQRPPLTNPADGGVSTPDAAFGGNGGNWASGGSSNASGGASGSTGGDANAGSPGYGGVGAEAGAGSGGTSTNGGANSGGQGASSGTGSTPEILRLDHVQMRGTHNSYHIAPIIAFDGSHKYTHAPLDRQLAEQGVRVLELDLHRANSDDSIDVYHITAIDARTTCLNFEDCLRAIRGWSENNPKHAPVIVWVEIKDDTGGPQFANLDKIDSVLREELGGRLFTPDDLRGSASSVREVLQKHGWPSLDSARGKFMFVVLSQDSDIDAYSAGYTSLAGKAMFVRVGFDKFDSSVAAFAKLDIGDDTGIDAAHKAGLMIATNVCAINHSDETCENNRVSAIAKGIHMLKDDLPAPVSGRKYFMDLPEGKPVACNPVRAPASCVASKLESL